MFLASLNIRYPSHMSLHPLVTLIAVMSALQLFQIRKAELAAADGKRNGSWMLTMSIAAVCTASIDPAVVSLCVGKIGGGIWANGK